MLDAANNALDKYDRVAVLEGIYAINNLRDQLTEFLKPFAESHIPVSKEDIQSFFEEIHLKRRKIQTD